MDNTPSLYESLNNLTSVMHAVLGFAPPNLVDNGALIRFDTDKPRNKTGWYVLHRLSTGGLVATFGCWKQGISHKWTSYNQANLSKAERDAIKAAQLKQAAILRAETDRNHEAARLKASREESPLFRAGRMSNSPYASLEGFCGVIYSVEVADDRKKIFDIRPYASARAWGLLVNVSIQDAKSLHAGIGAGET